MSMYNKLGTVEGYLQDAQSEVYCTTIRDRWCSPPPSHTQWQDIMLGTATAIPASGSEEPR